jgi:hypothetical protein
MLQLRKIVGMNNKQYTTIEMVCKLFKDKYLVFRPTEAGQSHYRAYINKDTITLRSLVDYTEGKLLLNMANHWRWMVDDSILITQLEESTPVKPIPAEENEIVELLGKAYKLFVHLEPQHPDETNDFMDGLHRLQYVMGMRILRRELPEMYPIVK